MKRSGNQRVKRSGFTLMELLVVLGILVLLIAIVTPKIIGTQEKADINAARIQIGTLKGALERYAVELKGFRYLPRQDNANGWVQRYAFYLSDDGRRWGQPVATGAFARNAEEQRVILDKPRRARFVRFVALAGFAGQPWASAAEIDVIR